MDSTDGLPAVVFRQQRGQPKTKSTLTASPRQLLESGQLASSQPRHARAATLARRACAAVWRSLPSAMGCRVRERSVTLEEVRGKNCGGCKTPLPTNLFFLPQQHPRSMQVSDVRPKPAAASSTCIHMHTLADHRRARLRVAASADFKTETERSFQNPDNFDPTEDEYGRPVRRLYSGRIKKRVRARS